MAPPSITSLPVPPVKFSKISSELPTRVSLCAEPVMKVKLLRVSKPPEPSVAKPLPRSTFTPEAALL